MHERIMAGSIWSSLWACPLSDVLQKCARNISNRLLSSHSNRTQTTQDM